MRYSAFERLPDEGPYRLVRRTLESLIDPGRDSLRFYRMGDRYQAKIEHVGKKGGYDPEGVLMV